MVPGLRLHASNAGGMGSILGQETKIPHTIQCGKKKTTNFFLKEVPWGKSIKCFQKVRTGSDWKTSYMLTGLVVQANIFQSSSMELMLFPLNFNDGTR